MGLLPLAGSASTGRPLQALALQLISVHEDLAALFAFQFTRVTFIHLAAVHLVDIARGGHLNRIKEIAGGDKNEGQAKHSFTLFISTFMNH